MVAFTRVFCMLLQFVCSVSVATFYLDSTAANWTVTPANNSFNISATVPGCIHLDLLAAGLIGEPNAGSNMQLQRWIASDNFTYRAQFIAPPALLGAHCPAPA